MLSKAHIFLSGLILLTLSLFTLTARAEELDGKALVNDYCTACHEQTDGGDLTRISQVRKTPEGWDMTIFRMQHLHGLDIDENDRFAIIKYLSDERGLAPQEAAPFRYVLEQRAHFVDKAPNDDLDALCGRCHTNARYGLQRRTEDDWMKHMHFHVGQFPSLEYQARSRDRFWWQEVTTKTYKELTALYPFENADWDHWKTTPHKSPEGSWRVSGHRPGIGDYEGIMTVKKDGYYFKASYDLHNMDGTVLKGHSKAVVYTGYEWRGTGEMSDTETREVYAMSESGNQMQGRWHNAAHYDVGGEFKAVRIKNATPEILVKSSDYIRIGEDKIITLYGVGLSGKISADAGLDVKVTKQTPTSVSLKIAANKDMTKGVYKITMGQAETDVVVYDKISTVKVFPDWTIARLGGGQTAPVSAQFEAVAYMKGEMGDTKIGIMPAKWQAHPFNEEAERLNDVGFSGTINQQGTFMPASAGPNKERQYATNNAGNLKIVAEISDGDHKVTGEAQLIVTVQRWNLPPIR
ncbi:MAG: quinohemoprotein amine dehydrogenase subunit alpha [Emcibacter sp.]|nr:quinohemoprotein amine dehydrogenase subunit alpha [Emcibacter sp.]